MPMIPDPIGLVPFVGIKLLGYSATGGYLRHVALQARGQAAGELDALRAVGFGATRTVLGLVCGAVYGVVASGFLPEGAGLPVLLLALAPLRILEWTAVLLLFFLPQARDPRFFWRGVLGGTLVSYLLDIPAWGVWSLFPGVGIC